MGMPQRDEPWESGGTGQQSTGGPHPEPDDHGAYQRDYISQGRDPGGERYDDGGQQYGYGGRWAGGPGGQQWSGTPGPYGSPVSEAETRVTGRRVIQYIIDYVITGAVASVILWALDRGSGAGNTGLVVVGVILDALWYFWYWVYRPYRAGGQSFGMQLLGLRIISKDGGRASMAQLLIRGILLIVDTLFWGLVGLITIVCSRYRQRVGDHAARTLVVRAQVHPTTEPRSYAGAGQAGWRPLKLRHGVPLSQTLPAASTCRYQCPGRLSGLAVITVLLVALVMLAMLQCLFRNGPSAGRSFWPRIFCISGPVSTF
jgi:uncharacterized RDD family membrane protein YckC